MYMHIQICMPLSAQKTRKRKLEEGFRAQVVSRKDFLNAYFADTIRCLFLGYLYFFSCKNLHGRGEDDTNMPRQD